MAIKNEDSQPDGLIPVMRSFAPDSRGFPLELSSLYQCLKQIEQCEFTICYSYGAQKDLQERLGVVSSPQYNAG
jgi:hypothetical protein